MGQVELAGKDALAAVQWISSNDASRLKIGQAHYSGLTTPAGTFVDDMLVYRFADDHFLLVVNASNVDKDFAWIAEQTRRFDAAAVNTSARYALIALQGPLAAAGDAAAEQRGPGRHQVLLVRPRRDRRRARHALADGVHRRGRVRSVRAAAAGRARCGTRSSRRAGTRTSIPAGLGARDTLRLEAAMRLYGNDIDDTTTVLDADLEWIIGWNKGDFLGRQALAEQKASGRRQQASSGSRWWTAPSRGTAIRVIIDGAAAGRVTSGTQTPFLKKAIGMAYVPVARRSAGHRVRRGHPGPAGPRDGRPAAVLQATERVTCIQPTSSTRRTTSGSR